MMSNLYGNPHSASLPSQLSATRVENIRLRLLSFFRADPNDFDLIFVANATAGVKLVVETLRALPLGFVYAHHQACHTSLVGVREEARWSACLGDDDVQKWMSGKNPFSVCSKAASAQLFSYSAQSHMDGRRYPLSWSKNIRARQPSGSPPVYTLLDAASYVSTSQLDLSDVDKAPDFTVMSLYKIFGYPDLGALIVRRQSEDLFRHRKYFGGGTVGMVVCGKEQWHAPKTESLHERLEDGTLPFHNIIALDTAMSVHERIFGSMDRVRQHTVRLSRQLLQGLLRLTHANGRKVCVVYTGGDDIIGTVAAGPIISFNLQNSEGAWVSLAEFEKLAALKNMHIRTGGLCSPGSIASALSLEPWEMRRNFSSGWRCGTDNDVIAGKPTGVIRVSLGAMSTTSDVQQFLQFVADFYVETSLPTSPTLLGAASGPHDLQVKTITIYPIKSCGGYSIPKNARWEVRPEGLAWDREWCLVHRGTGQALSQKRYPRMALLKPEVDLIAGLLRVVFADSLKKQPDSVTIPLSFNPSLFDASPHQMPSRVCGEEIKASTYASELTNRFFSSALGVDCVLARFPPGGHGSNSRSSKARIQAYQQRMRTRNLPGSFPDIPSPPDSDSDSELRNEGKILLANESPILLISSSSVQALNRDITSKGGAPVSEATFRANIVVEPLQDSCPHQPFSEDAWSSMRIGVHDFKFLGACRRCQMVCVNQSTGERGQEPFVTLAKTRRFDGKVYFGSHMRHEPMEGMLSEESQYPTIQVGDSVSVDG